MNSRRFWGVVITAVALGILSPAARSQNAAAQQLAIVDEKLDKLRADVEALQFNQQRLQKQVDEMQAQLLELRRAGSSITASDLQALESRVRAIDAAREKDKQIILDTLAKELESISRGKPIAKAPGNANVNTAPTADGAEHVVQKGETLAAIAKTHGVSVAALAKSNNLTKPDEIRVGQKLVIPK